jgi:hypothetical protein
MGKSRYRSKNSRVEEAVGVVVITAVLLAAEFIGAQVVDFVDKTFNPQQSKSETRSNSKNVRLLTM